MTVNQEHKLHKPSSWSKCKSFVVVQTINISCIFTILNTTSFCGSRNRVVVDIFWNTCSLLILYASYDERTYCTPVMMSGPIVHQLWCEDLLYASERTYCTPVMMSGPIVHQLWCEDLLYASYDERTYCTPVMMRGPIVNQLWWEDLLYTSYDERTYCMPVMHGKIQRGKAQTKEDLEVKFYFFCGIFCSARLLPYNIKEDSRHVWSQYRLKAYLGRRSCLCEF